MGDDLQGGSGSDGQQVASLRDPRSRSFSILRGLVVIATIRLAGCTLPQSGTQPATSTVYDFQGADFKTLMYSAADAYANAMAFGDTTHVNNAISGCYQQYNQGAQYQNVLGAGNVQGQLRRCLEIDYLAYKDNQALTNRGLPGNPYVSSESLDARWGHYGPLAGFQDANSMFEYARAGYAIAKPAEMGALRNRRGIQMPALHNPTGTFGF